MNQILRIVAKDAAHFWKEVVLSWCLLSVFVWETGQKWSWENGTYYMGGGATILFGSQPISFLLVLSWCVLIVRLVQDESLVGDRQFWITRPYDWVKLLIAKTIFLLFSIGIPLLIAQLVMLRLAGFPALPYLPGLFYIQAELLLFSAVLVVLATITASLVQVVLAAFVLLLYMIGHSGLVSMVSNSGISVNNPFDTALGFVLFAAIVAVILIQYARRRTSLSRGIVIGFAVLATIVGLLTPYAILIAKTYPRMTSENAPLQVSLDTGKKMESAVDPRFARPIQNSKPEKKVTLYIPLKTSPPGGEHIIEISGTRVRIDLPGGGHWQSNWTRQGFVVIVPDLGPYASIEMPSNVFELVKSTPANVEVELALSIFRKTGEEWTVIAQDGDFPAPKLGLCSVFRNPMVLTCRNPLYGLPSLLATASWAESTCKTSKEGDPSTIGYYPHLESSPQPVPGINPVVEETMYFSTLTRAKNNEESSTPPHICPGTPIHFSSLEFVRKTSMMASLGQVRLSDYRLQRGTVGGAVGIGLW